LHPHPPRAARRCRSCGRRRHRGGLAAPDRNRRSEEHTSELQSRFELVCRLLLEKKNPSREGRVGLSAGGIIPCVLPTTNTPSLIKAPGSPAAIQATYRPSFTSLPTLNSEDCFF